MIALTLVVAAVAGVFVVRMPWMSPSWSQTNWLVWSLHRQAWCFHKFEASSPKLWGNCLTLFVGHCIHCIHAMRFLWSHLRLCIIVLWVMEDQKNVQNNKKNGKNYVHTAVVCKCMWRAERQIVDRSTSFGLVLCIFRCCSSLEEGERMQKDRAANWKGKFAHPYFGEVSFGANRSAKSANTCLLFSDRHPVQLWTVDTHTTFGRVKSFQVALRDAFLFILKR